MRIIILFLFLGQLCFAQNNVDKLIDSLSFASQDKDKAKLAIKIASELQTTDWKRALHYIEYAETAAENIDEELSAEIYESIGLIFDNKDMLDVALDYYTKAYNYYKNNDKEKYRLENSLGIMHAKLNNEERALYYFRNQLKYYTRTKDYERIANSNLNIGTVHLNNGIHDSALAYFNKALQYADKIKKPQQKLVLYNNLAGVYGETGNYKKAIFYFNKALNFADETKQDSEKPWVYNAMARLYLRKNEPDSSLFYSFKSRELLNGLQNSFQNKYAVQNIYKAYLQKEDYRNATKYYDEYITVSDSLNIEAKALNVEKLRLEQEYKDNEQQRILKEKDKQFQYILYGSGMLIVLLFLVILLIRNKNKLSKAQLEKELIELQQRETDATLELKNKELMTSAVRDVQRAELRDQILKELKKIKLQSSKKETQEAVDTIIKQIMKNSTADIWKEFELRHGQVYETFYNILSKKHPELTSKDRRLCALLKLNLTTKEISSITGQSVKSLENARTRLRKKLELTNTSQSLINYLDSLQ